MLLDHSGDAAKGSDIEVVGNDYSARSAEKFFAFIFSYQDGLSWHFRTLKTRKRRFQTICSHRSLALSTVATAAETIASPMTSSQIHAAESGSKRAGAPCHKSRVLAVETNTSRSLKNTKIETHTIQLPEGKHVVDVYYMYRLAATRTPQSSQGTSEAWHPRVLE